MSSDAVILRPEVCRFLAQLHVQFRGRIKDLLYKRVEVQRDLDEGVGLCFRRDTRHIRDDDKWQGPSIPHDLQDRRVEITGPPVRKMVINALNSGAKVFMADFEDSNSPTFDNNVQGQVNLYDAIRRQIDFSVGEKEYKLNDEVATLMVRPRGLHLVEKGFKVGGLPIPASLFDFGVYFYNNAKELIKRSSGPYFYIPKLESMEEAELWADIFRFAEEYIGISTGTIRATVLIETITAAFQMDEIIHALRDYSAGLNCGRWDYIFSFIKRHAKDPHFILPDRTQVTMEAPCMEAYCKLLINTCHKRGVHAMGGMSAQIPIKGDEEANHVALSKVRDDKKREVELGHDGTWIAHPGLLSIALGAFSAITHNQINQLIVGVGPEYHSQTAPNTPHEAIGVEDLLEVPKGIVTEEGVRTNIRVGLQYIDAWLKGNGCVALYNLMEDAATAEISRAQLWQWLKHEVELEDGRLFTHDLFGELFEDELGKLEVEPETIELFTDLVVNRKFPEFLTLEAYNLIAERSHGGTTTGTAVG